MLGAICGDVIGSVFEHDNVKSKSFPIFQKDSRFTDDTVLSCAIADSLIHDRPFAENLKRFYNWYPKAGYGFMYSRWARSDDNVGYNSYGNGSAMRVSPVAWAFDSIDAVKKISAQTAEATHNHPEGIKGAQTIALATFIARMGGTKADIAKLAIDAGYNLDRTLDEIRPDYHFSATCQDTVPEAIIAFLEATDFEDALRSAISISGDSDTIACMTGSIAEAFWGSVPAHIRDITLSRLDSRLLGVFELFEQKYITTST